jgi:hypothetical protein
LVGGGLFNFFWLGVDALLGVFFTVLRFGLLTPNWALAYIGLATRKICRIGHPGARHRPRRRAVLR